MDIINKYSSYCCKYIAILLICGLSLVSCSDSDDLLHINLATPKSTLTSLVWITKELGYFKEQGIDLELREYPSGKRALKSMLNNEVDLAISAETPFVIESFKHDDLRLYATLGQSDNEVRILARRDFGINEAANLKGKTFATQAGSSVHFFLTSFILYHQLSSSDTRIKFMKAEQLSAAISSGDIDAISMREPYLNQIYNEIGSDKLIEFSMPGLYTKTYNIVGVEGFADKYPGAMEKILFALNKGANYIDENTEKSVRLISKVLQLPLDRVTSLWPDMRLSVTLNQGLLSALKEEAQWAVSIGLIKWNSQSEVKAPDFVTRLDPVPLESSVPFAVGLIGVKPR